MDGERVKLGFQFLDFDLDDKISFAFAILIRDFSTQVPECNHCLLADNVVLALLLVFPRTAGYPDTWALSPVFFSNRCLVNAILDSGWKLLNG